MTATPELDIVTMTDAQVLVLGRMAIDWGWPMRDIAADIGVPEKVCLGIARQFDTMGLARVGPWYDEDSSAIKGRGYSLNAAGDDAQTEVAKFANASARDCLIAKQEGVGFYIVDVRAGFRGNLYITLWRPKNAGYAYPLPWAGEYSREAIDANPDYYHRHRYGTARAFDRFPVPCDLVQRFATNPEPGRIDGNAGPVIPNTAAVRAALRHARYVPAGLRNLRKASQ